MCEEMVHNGNVVGFVMPTSDRSLVADRRGVVRGFIRDSFYDRGGAMPLGYGLPTRERLAEYLAGADGGV